MLPPFEDTFGIRVGLSILEGMGMEDENGVEFVRCRFLGGTASEEGRGIALGLPEFEYDECESVVE